jgi:hypothetical protein
MVGHQRSRGLPGATMSWLLRQAKRLPGQCEMPHPAGFRCRRRSKPGTCGACTVSLVSDFGGLPHFASPDATLSSSPETHRTTSQ